MTSMLGVDAHTGRGTIFPDSSTSYLLRLRCRTLGSSWPGQRGAGLTLTRHEELLATRHLDDQVPLAVVTG